MKLKSTIAVATVITGAWTIQTSGAQTIKAGTFDKTAIVVAYYRSPQWDAIMKPKLIEMQDAKRANDIKKAQDLDNWGKAQQETAHRQLAGDASITNILVALQPAWPEIARKAQVQMIAFELTFADTTIEKVDITGQILDWLKADAATRKVILEMQR